MMMMMVANKCIVLTMPAVLIILRTTQHPLAKGYGYYNTHLKVKVKLLSHVRIFEILLTVAYKAPQSMGFSRQEY